MTQLNYLRHELDCRITCWSFWDYKGTEQITMKSHQKKHEAAQFIKNIECQMMYRLNKSWIKSGTVDLLSYLAFLFKELRSEFFWD